ISQVRAGNGKAVLIVASETESSSVVSLDLTTRERRVLSRPSQIKIDSAFLSIPRAIEFPTEDDLTAHGFFYPAVNANYGGPVNEGPPLLVMSHGGPTSATSSSLRYTIQYWTSRGIAVVDVNYGGSAGYGRSYRERLKGNWGIVDVDDCVNAARYLS